MELMELIEINYLIIITIIPRYLLLQPGLVHLLQDER